MEIENPTPHSKIAYSECLLRRVALLVLCVCFCYGALKLDLSRLFTTCFLWTSLQFILYVLCVCPRDVVKQTTRDKKEPRFRDPATFTDNKCLWNLLHEKHLKCVFISIDSIITTTKIVPYATDSKLTFMRKKNIIFFAFCYQNTCIIELYVKS